MRDEQTGSESGSRTTRLGMLTLGFVVGVIVTIVIVLVVRMG